MALLYSLFVESGVIPSDSTDQRMELLTDAASSILASLQASQPDMGAQLAVRLLLPHATAAAASSSSGAIAVAAVANILDHYAPSTDQYARTMLALCQPLVVNNQSALVLDGCSSLALYLHRQHSTLANATTATVMLLDGVALESHLLSHQPTLGSCYRRLTAECHAVSLHLLHSIVEQVTPAAESSLDGAICVKADGMAVALKHHTSRGIPAAVQLLHVVAIFASCSTPREVNHAERGHHIVACLSNDTTTHTITTPTPLHLPLLRIARALIEESSLSKSQTACGHSAAAAPFDAPGVAVLLERLQEVEPLAIAERSALEACFLQALVQATVAENAKKQRERRRDDVEKITYGDFAKYDVEVQKRTVAQMLDY